jgi:hypothetical protein
MNAATKAAAEPVPVPRLLLSDDEAGLAWGMSARKFRDVADELGIKPVVLGPRMVRWPLSDLQAAIERMPRQEKRSEPAELLRSRIDRMASRV